MDVKRQISVLNNAISSNKSKIGFFIGAGCPTSIHIGSDKKHTPLTPNIAGLTKSVISALKEEGIEKITSRIKKTDRTSITIEDILSLIRDLLKVINDSSIDEINAELLETLERKICSEITKEVSKDLPVGQCSYCNFAAWIKARKQMQSLEIFTPNYDLLLEQALERYTIPYFDGFIGSHQAFFDLHSIENDEFPARWVKLWKLHGSINWWRDDNNSQAIYRGVSETTETAKQMIYPSHLKFDQSRRMPFLAMQDRLSKFLSYGQTVLITCGYSFADEHLNGIIADKLSANPNAICFGLLYDNLEIYSKAKELATKLPNLTLLAKDNCVVGTQKYPWEKGGSETEFAFISDIQPSGNVICKIGDFELLTKFLVSQIGVSSPLEEDKAQ